MHIVLFVPRYWPAVGGIEKYTRELSKSLVAMGHRVTVVAGAHKAGLPEHEEHEGIDVLRYPAYRSRLRCWLHLARLRRLFVEADVVHISDVLMVEYFQTMLGWMMPRRALYLTRHGLSYRCPVPLSEKRRAGRAARWVNGIIDDGAFIARWLGVPCDVALDQGLSPPADAIEQVPEPRPDRAVFVGRLEWDTGIELYLDALRVLKSRHGIPLHLDVYGGGSLEKRLRTEAARDALSVTFHGFVENAQEHLADGCFAFVGGRLAIQEAMARRRLVIAAYVNELKRDYVCNESFSPYLLAAGSAADIANHVAHYAHDAPARCRLVDRAFAHARTLSWERTARSYVRLWRTHSTNTPAAAAWLDRVALAVRLGVELR